MVIKIGKRGNMVDLMMFNDFDEFLSRRYTLKIYYFLLSYDQKRSYKKYIYSLPYRESVKDVMWSFLNEPSGEMIYDSELWEIERLYARNKNYIEL